MKQMEVITFVLGDLETNCYLVVDRRSKTAVVIDPADNGGYISEKILEKNLTLTAILLTHGHFDHVLGLLELKLNFPTALIYLHHDDLFLLKQAGKSSQYWLKRQTDPVPSPDRDLKDNQKIKIGSESLTVMATAGHTKGSVCFYSKKDKILFSGDTLFKNGIGRTNFKYASASDMRNSLKKILKLPKETIVYSGHGEETTIGEEI